MSYHLNPAEALTIYDFNQLDAGVQTEYYIENIQKASARITNDPPIDLPEPQVDDLQ